jgi:hypothetical protein
LPPGFQSNQDIGSPPLTNPKYEKMRKKEREKERKKKEKKN